ncbi:cell division protein FtsA [Aureimonas jatrophae]|jgi:cell division protein FtsA|uniref:Cell division protein FtsA n=1 Tax=Aureimonas jatrophae TaxID=1166073 RepID=A0A1H0CEC5_9HYPH|nr:cell division protein FtsA [Aureimonas jatrophae]MBB3949197.1 cell division protein FtsA [Aureimonas jatrophae]SDN56225.1 cell division protein FtsA [Aureimonas jatrophae]
MTIFSRKGDELPRLKKPSDRRVRTISVLDIGSSKVTCLIARLKPRPESEVLPGRTHVVEVVGIGHQRSRGVKSGVVVDLDAAEASIRHCVDAAERMAGLTIESLIVSVTAGRLKSLRGSARLAIESGEVTAEDLAEALAAAGRTPLREGRLALHRVPFDLSLDGETGLENPVGMTGSELGADLHILSAEETPLRNLETAINRAHLVVEAFVATPYASGLSTLVDDEALMGSACIDMGAGSTTISIFQNGHFAYADAVALGGHHITMDLARGLSIRPEQAERLKVMHGNALPGFEADSETVAVAPLGDDSGEQPINVSRNLVARIIRPRVEETLELIRDRLNASNLGHVIGKRVVLTGGASQLSGLNEAARLILHRNVRLGRPLGVAGLSASNKSPAFATAVGLLIYPQVAAVEHVPDQSRLDFAFDRRTRVGRFGSWLRRSF